MDTSIFKYALSMTSYFFILIFIVSFMSKHYKFATYFWIASLCTFPLWLMGGVEGWFRWAKILSVIIPTIFVGYVRMAKVENKEGKVWKALRKDWPLWILYGVLFLNIAEATLKDFAMGNLANAACGFLLCVTIPFAGGNRFWTISTKNGDKGDLICYTTVGWNFLYTTWNACFVYAEGATFFASSLCILLAAEIYPIIKGRPELYITARVYTLAAHLLIRACAPDLFPSIMNSSTWFNQTVLEYWGIINFILIVPFVFWHMYQLHSGKADVSFKRGKISSPNIKTENL